jgi:hypothetical protein
MLALAIDQWKTSTTSLPLETEIKLEKQPLPKDYS